MFASILRIQLDVNNRIADFTAVWQAGKHFEKTTNDAIRSECQKWLDKWDK
ncbi:MAG TPA: hypothetical protein VF575_01125 [Candidatus Saccharimonadales bacterium]|jgi:hypothetical protein